MDRASKRLPAGVLLGAVVLASGTVVPCAAPNAATPAHGLAMFTPGLGCGPAETQVGTAKLLARVRADAAPAFRRGPRHVARLPAPPTRQARKPSRAQEEPRAAVVRSFYTCNAAALPNFAEGTGWRLVGPLRRS